MTKRAPGPYKLEGFKSIGREEAEALKGNLAKGQSLVMQKREGVKLSGTAHVRSTHSTAASKSGASGLVECLANRHAKELSAYKKTSGDGTLTSFKTQVKKRPGGFTVVAKKICKKADGLLVKGRSKQVQKREKGILDSAARSDRTRSLADEGNARFDQSNSRGLLRVANFDAVLASRSPWVIHFAKPKKGKASPSRVLSVTKMARASDGHIWVAGDVVPAMKKADLVGASISIDDTTQCQKVAPMRVVDM